MSVSGRYRESWEGFWREAPGRQGAVFWDAEPVLTAGVHLAHFEPLLVDPGLPLVDLGCGNGTQSRFLAAHFTQVIGVDLSAAALDRARDADPDEQVTYQLLDASDKGEPENLHAELGDANIYMRGVLHQAAPEDRQQMVDGIANARRGTRPGLPRRALRGGQVRPRGSRAEPRRAARQAGAHLRARHRPW
ncbi:SAM-dependent methyltransferase [Streptomyces sp. SAI-144]|nr:SAM-dependent methyltransferase [Streptomyces sp. SAI-144]